MRHLPVYILIDTSGSMKGEPIESVKVGLADMIATLRQDPYALETVCISIITFDRDVNQVLPLTELENLQLPNIVTPDSGPTHMGAALKMLCDKIDVEVKKPWAPVMRHIDYASVKIHRGRHRPRRKDSRGCGRPSRSETWCNTADGSSPRSCAPGSRPLSSQAASRPGRRGRRCRNWRKECGNNRCY